MSYSDLKNAIRQEFNVPGKSKVIAELLSAGCEVNGPHDSPLHYAVKYSNIETMEMLLEKGADVNAPDTFGVTPFHYAVQECNVDKVKILLDWDPDIDKKDQDGNTPFQNLICYSPITSCHPDSVKNQEREILELLLNRGANINNKNNEGMSAIHTAVENEDFEIVEYLLNWGADVNITDGRICKEKDVGDEDDEQSLENDLFNTGLRQSGRTPLHLAVLSWNITISALLIRYGACVNARDENQKSPLFYAVNNNDVEITRLLLANGADPNEQPNLLIVASDDIYKKIFKVLIKHGADINAPDKDEITVLHHILKEHDHSENNHYGRLCYHHYDEYTKVIEDIVELLITEEADVDARDKDGATPLYLSTHSGYGKVVKMLLRAGANVNAKRHKHADTALHVATDKYYLEIVEDLLKFGADIDCKDMLNRTALHRACQNVQPEVVTTLLEYGADIRIQDDDGNTPLDCVMIAFEDSKEDHNSDICSLRLIKHILLSHTVKMRTANFYVYQDLCYITKYLQLFAKIDEFTDVREMCISEIERMKREIINDTNISFHDILFRTTHRSLIYAKNKKITEALELDDYISKFPIYGKMIKAQFWKRVQRRELLDRSIEFFFFLIPELPHNCVEKILNYLSDRDLKILLDQSVSEN